LEKIDVNPNFVKLICYIAKMRLLIFSFLIFNFFLASAQSLSPTAGARGLAMGNAAVTFSDINSIFSNQAGLAELEKTEIILFAGQKYFVNDIRNIAAAIAYPTDLGTFGLNLHYYGFQDYNEQKIGVNYARKLTQNLSLGIQLNYLSFRISEYGSRGLISAEIGVRSEILDGLVIAAHIANPVRIEVVDGENLPTVFKFGAAYLPSNKLTITAEVEKDIEFSASVKFGIEYQLADPFFIRMGIATNPTLFNFGMGFIIKERLIIDVAASYHQTLGFSPALSVRFGF
jgi:hypothetical protein